MYKVDKKIDFGGECFFIKLNPNKTLNPFTWKPPITWEGYINGDRISLIQVSQYASWEKDFDFSAFPKKYDHLKYDIIKAIDKAMKVMD